MLSILRKSWLYAFLGLVALAAQARAQEEYIPFEGLGDYDTDYQFFEPYELDDYGGFPPPNTGWYGQYERVYMNGTRPNFEPSRADGDFGWGNRAELGYMTEGGTGWQFAGLSMGGGVSVATATYVPRLGFDPTATTSNPFTPNTTSSFNQGNPNYDPRINQDLLINTLNEFRFSTVEFNRVWRLDPTHNGAIIEPFAGIRYASLKDHTRRMNQFQIAAAGFEQVRDQLTYWENSMFGGQVGVRLAKQSGRILWGTELRVMGLSNFQHFNQAQYTTTRLYTTAPIIAATAPAQEFLTFTEAYGSETEFVIAGDVRVTAAYAITRDISARVGLEWMGFGKGIARGNNLAANTGDFYLMGVTFGVDINR